MKEFVGIGRRKTAVSCVRMREGSGVVQVNGVPFSQYFTLEIERGTILSPFLKIGDYRRYDCLVSVKGGGVSAQVIATRLAISRALVLEDASRRAILKSDGYLTRDGRKKERKKYGLRKARKRSQFSKR